MVVPPFNLSNKLIKPSNKSFMINTQFKVDFYNDLKIKLTQPF
jgi:hypothetical protein